MFVQLIEGRARPEELRAAGEAWNETVRPVAGGFLGATGGVGPDGTAILVARFADRTAAEANNDRPQQQAWFEAHNGGFDGEPSFQDSEDVEELFGGGSDEAGFVQIMQGTCSDRETLSRLESSLEDALRSARPDLLGGLRVWHGGGRFTDVNYFTSEPEAREGESRMEERMGAELEQWSGLVQPDRWIDLTPPNLILL